MRCNAASRRASVSAWERVSLGFGRFMADVDKGVEATEQMFAAIGVAITRWSFVEEQLCNLFTVCTHDVSARPDGGLDFGSASVPTAVFFAVESFRGKLSITDAAVSARLCLSDASVVQLKLDWARLCEKARKLSLKRNRLAHYTVLPGFDLDEGTIQPRLVPAIGSPGYWRETGSSPGKQALTLQQLRHLDHAFCILENKLRALTQNLARNEELFDRYAQRLANRIHSHSHKDPIRAERLKRALSSLDEPEF